MKRLLRILLNIFEFWFTLKIFKILTKKTSQKSLTRMVKKSGKKLQKMFN